MSDQIIVATFNNTNAAYDAATALKALKDKGITDFKPKAGVMVKKDDKGNLSVIESKERPSVGNRNRHLGGALIGLSGGPWCGDWGGDRCDERTYGRRGDRRAGFRLCRFSQQGNASRNDRHHR